MDEVLEAVVALQTSGQRGALSSLVWSSGSIPMSDRAKMLVAEDGQVLGTIGGGCLEAEILSLASQVIRTQESQVSCFTLTEEQAGEGGLNCGGSLRILTEPVGSPDLYPEIVRARQERRACALVSALGAPGGEIPKLLVVTGRSWLGTLGAADLDQWAVAQAESLIGQGRNGTAVMEATPRSAGQVELFIEPFLPPPMLYIFGGGHVGGQVCRLAAQVGFRVVMVDDRPQFANARRHPEAAQWVVGDMGQVFAELPIDEQSYVIAATRGHQHDEVVIEKAIRTPARYIGMLGSERKKLLLWRRLEERGGARQRLDQIYAPVGLNIGADTPEEIAVSVVAELIRVRRGAVKRWKTKTMEPQP
ncbi:MAG: XdhC/CoxI family protein [Candidatus Latescibacteria bacterium]|nr:XdhC/CoxI family protein [Candidatus Latescibacterota bacterium]